ncbi:Nup85 nucleoporin-domain-containing protein [Phyllosticta citriasiana]|uniref:Nup85 nucleoporin-domain-containing protein n=1 Tax=Phyllosticta citriasiana TaxID=595635 RepID=UPI0030FD3DB3
MESTHFHVHSLNEDPPDLHHDQQQHHHHHHHRSGQSQDSTGSICHEEDCDAPDNDPKRRCNCLNHRHRRRPSPVRIKYEPPSALSRMYGHRDNNRENNLRKEILPSTPYATRRSSMASTTPAGRPPGTNRTSRSTTPTGPPPTSRSSIFGTSYNRRTPARNTPSPQYPFGRPSPSPSQKGRTLSSHPTGRGRGRSHIPTRSQSARSFYSAPSSSPPRHPFDDDQTDDGHYNYGPFDDEPVRRADDMDPPVNRGYGFDYDQMDEDDPPRSHYNNYGMMVREEYEDAVMEEDEDAAMDEDPFAGKAPSRKSSRPASPTKFNTNGSVRASPTTRSRASTMHEPRPPAFTQLGAPPKTYDIGRIAKGLATSARAISTLQEPDDLILETERILNRLGESDASEEALSIACRDLCNIWNHPHTPLPDVIGPADNESSLVKADFVTSLLLPIHHPPPSESGKNNLSLSRRGQISAFSASQFSKPKLRGHKTIPKVLLDWLQTRHDPSAADFESLLKLGGDYSAQSNYWDNIFSSVMRGNFNDAITFLQKGNFSVAETAVEDGFNSPGYRGSELTIVEDAVLQAIELLEACPAHHSDDWDIKGREWSMYRMTVDSTLNDLGQYAEGEGAMYNPRDDGRFSFSTASRRAESRVPYTIYENLQLLYNLLLGNPEEIIGASFDWLEAVVFLTAWWDGEEEDEVPQGSLAASRRSLRRPQQTRTVDITPAKAYQKRLELSLARVMAEDDPGLSIDSNNPIEIALACVMEENMEGLLSLTRGWSLTLTAAIVEVASAGGWLGDTPASRNLLKNFNQSDLMVLSFGVGDKQGPNKDEILQQYADLLFNKTGIESSEGWELAIQVLGRLDHAEAAKDKISELLDRLPLSSSDRVDKILSVCTSLGLIDHANMIAERYATALAENSYNYGAALFYYARAHNSKKIRDVLDLLISLCLIHSSAYPRQADLDDRLRALITNPKQTLSQLSRSDLEAAQLLSKYLSGYATLRRFYDLRDEEGSSLRPLHRKRLAAEALIAVISSASDSIRGGLYDPDVDSAVQVDGLLTLFGEVLPFINHRPSRLLSLDDLTTLLGAVEDLQTSPSLVYTQCEEHLQAAMSQGQSQVQGGAAQLNASPPRALKKSISNLTGSSYSLLGGSGSLLPSTEGSGVLVAGADAPGKRGWDWRKGVRKGVTGNDLCTFMRKGIAEEVGRAWIEGMG